MNNEFITNAYGNLHVKPIAESVWFNRKQEGNVFMPIMGKRINDTRLVQSPLSDCQTFSISYFAGILMLPLEQRYQVLREVYRLHIGKPQLLVNVTQDYKKQLEETCDGYFVFKQEYKSTRNSMMTMCLINLRDLIYAYEKRLIEAEKTRLETLKTTEANTTIVEPGTPISPITVEPVAEQEVAQPTPQALDLWDDFFEEVSDDDDF